MREGIGVRSEVRLESAEGVVDRRGCVVWGSSPVVAVTWPERGVAEAVDGSSGVMTGTLGG